MKCLSLCAHACTHTLSLYVWDVAMMDEVARDVLSYLSMAITQLMSRTLVPS